VINSERAALGSPGFVAKMVRTRNVIISDLCTTYCKEKDLRAT